MEILLSVLKLAAGIVLLYYGAEYLVRGSVMLARKSGISTLVIGLTFVAFGTSAPELVVSVASALRGQPDISLGNVIGSNICNIALILGLCAVISPMACAKELLKFDVLVMLRATLLFTGVYYLCGGLNRISGILFLICLILYVIRSIFAGRRDARKEELSAEPEKKKYILFFAILFCIGGLAGLVFGADLFVDGSVTLARMFHIPEAVIGLTLVAVGTSLPELATSLVAACRHENDIAIGNVVGSNIFNILAILGIAPIIKPIAGNSISPVDFGVMLFVSFALAGILWIGKAKISRKSGIFLFAVYLLYLAWLIRISL